MNTAKKNSNRFFYVLMAVLVLVLVYFMFFGTNNNKNQLSLGEAKTYFAEDKVEQWGLVGSNKVVLKLTEQAGSTIQTEQFPAKYDFYVIADRDTLATWETTYGDLKTEYQPPSPSAWDTIYPIVMIALAGVFIFFLYKMMSGKGNGTMGFGKSRARSATNVKVKFADIAGAEEEKTELREIVEFLRFPQKFTQLGARIPKGVLLVGPPGTGKTLLARAVAGESGVPFLSISGSDFVEMFVGVGASRVRDLFEQAKQSAPCIVFIDEIDAVGRQRGAGLGGSNDEREQTLNQLLVELDGFESNQGIIVLAATNRSDVLDPALLRPGRFDRQVYVYPPDVKGREGILRIHAKNKPLAEDVDFTTLARITSGFTGADIENMLNESAILAARAGRLSINMEDITEGINKVLMGPQKKSSIITENDKKITAYHEAGHAILHKKLEFADDVHEVSIIPRGMAGGYTSSRPVNDDKYYTKSKLNDILAAFMGGRVAEEIALGDIQAGASSDIERATNLARRMVTEWGMSEKFGFMGFATAGQVFIGRDYQEKNVYSEKLAGEIDEEIKKILDFNYARAKKILTENKDLLDKLAQLLIERETVYKEEIDMLMEGKSVEEIVKVTNEKDLKRKEQEKTRKFLADKEENVETLKGKLRVSEVFLKQGIISEQEYKSVQEMYDVAVKDLEEAKAEIEKSKSENQSAQDIEIELDSENNQEKEAKKPVETEEGDKDEK